MASLGSLKELIMAFADARVDEIVRPVIATLESNSSDTVKVRLALLGLKLPGRFTFLTWHDNVKSCQIPRWRGNLVGPFSPWAPRSLPFVSQMSGQP